MNVGYMPAALGARWAIVGCFSGLSWELIAVVLGLLWDCLGVVLGVLCVLFWGCLGVVLELPWVLSCGCSGGALSLSWACLGAVLGTGVVLGVVRFGEVLVWVMYCMQGPDNRSLLLFLRKRCPEARVSRAGARTRLQL